MPALFSYLLKLSVSLAVVFLFYHFVLRKLTFYCWNRWYLFIYTIACLFIPFIDISSVLHRNQWTDITIVQWIPVLNEPSKTNNASPASFNYWNLTAILLISGIVFMLCRLLIQLISFRRMMKKAELISGEELKVYQVNDSIIPFSFGNSVFINRNLHTAEELQEIIRHEFVHVKQKHSFDIIWGELLCMINWYNPFAWLLKKSIRQNLEFIADKKVVENGIDKKKYQYLLLKVIGNSQYSIANQFNFSSLKKRIAMMNKNKSKKTKLLRFLFLLPLLAIILLSFRNKMGNSLLSQKTIRANVPAVTSDTIPQNKLPDDYVVFLKRNPEIKDTYWNRSPFRITIKFKNGTTETYNLENKNEVAIAEKKYGKLPMAPPPPPPLLTNDKEDKLNKNIDKIEVNDKTATVSFNNNKTEVYNLAVAEEKNNFEKKYGKIIDTDYRVASTYEAKTAVSVVSSQAAINAKPSVAVHTDVMSVVSRPASVTVASIASQNDMLAVDQNEQDAITPADILVTITKNTRAEELEDLKKKMKEKDIELNYDEIEYDNGVLVKITGNIKSKESSGNFTAVDFEKLILSMIKKGIKTSFKVTVQDKKIITN